MIESHALEVFDELEQGTPEWFASRAGIVTASEFSTVMAKGRGGGDSATRKNYMRKLAAERVTGKVVQTWSGNQHTERGHAMEPEARDLYAFLRDEQPRQVGFMRRGPVGCSPDSLVGDDGMLEIKTKLPHLQIEVLEAGVLPPQHKAQVQGQLWVSGRQWADFLSYWPDLPPLLVRVERDEEYIAELSGAVAQFIEELNQLAARIAALKEAA